MNDLGLARCGNNECPKKNECSRYTEDKNVVCVEFKNICNEKNEFKWFDKKNN
jgi:hypothetical protein